MRYKRSLPDMPWTTPWSGLCKRTLELGSKRLSVVEYSAAMTPHWCDDGHVGYVVSGKLKIQFDRGDIVNYYPGNGILIPQGLSTATWSTSSADRSEWCTLRT